MAKVRNEANRSKNLSFAAQVSSRTPAEEKTLRDFNSRGRNVSVSNRVDGTQGKAHARADKPQEVAKEAAKQRGKELHQQATQQKNNDRSP